MGVSVFAAARERPATGGPSLGDQRSVPGVRAPACRLDTYASCMWHVHACTCQGAGPARMQHLRARSTEAASSMQYPGPAKRFGRRAPTLY